MSATTFRTRRRRWLRLYKKLLKLRRRHWDDARMVLPELAGLPPDNYAEEKNKEYRRAWSLCWGHKSTTPQGRTKTGDDSRIGGKK